jgi:hypothetical protein
MSRLPQDWNRLPVDALWNALNDPRRFATPASTVEAIMFTVRKRGVEALQEPANIARLSVCDAAAMAEIKRRCAKAVPS